MAVVQVVYRSRNAFIAAHRRTLVIKNESTRLLQRDGDSGLANELNSVGHVLFKTAS